MTSWPVIRGVVSLSVLNIVVFVFKQGEPVLVSNKSPCGQDTAGLVLGTIVITWGLGEEPLLLEVWVGRELSGLQSVSTLLLSFVLNQLIIHFFMQLYINIKKLKKVTHWRSH